MVTKRLCTPFPISGIPHRSILIVPAVAVICIRITPMWPIRSSGADGREDQLVDFAVRLLSATSTCGRTLPPGAPGAFTNKPEHFFVERLIVVVFGRGRLYPNSFSNLRIRATHRIFTFRLVGSISGTGNRSTGCCSVFPHPAGRGRTDLILQTRSLPPRAREIVPVSICALLVLSRTTRPTLNPGTVTGDPQPLLFTVVPSITR